jgi:L-asparaginase
VRLLLVHTGGTLMMQGGPDTPLKPESYSRDLLAEVPALATIADVDTRVLSQIDSSDMQPERWIDMARTIHGALPDYDGVVVVHGTDTMVYSASALAFLLPDLDKPVILTGSQRPISALRSDARQNLIDAFMLATMGVPEVGICFASKLLRGCRATKVDAWGLDAYASPECPPLAQLGIEIEIGAHVLGARARTAFDDRLEPSVLAVRLFPGLEPRLLIGAIDAGVRGLVLKAFGAGNVPTLQRSLVGAIEHATSLDVPVVVVSQCLRAHVDLGRYAGGQAARAAGAIGGGDMTDEAALTKLMVTLGRYDEAEGRVRAARRAFAEATVGEMTLPPPGGASTLLEQRRE